MKTGPLIKAEVAAILNEYGNPPEGVITDLTTYILRVRNEARLPSRSLPSGSQAFFEAAAIEAFKAILQHLGAPPIPATVAAAAVEVANALHDAAYPPSPAVVHAVMKGLQADGGVQ